MVTRTIDMGKQGFTDFAQTQLRQQEFMKQLKLEQLESRYKRELDFQKSVVRLGFAWNVLQLDLNSFSRKYFGNVSYGTDAPARQEFTHPLAHKNSRLGPIVLMSIVEKSVLTQLVVGNTQAGFLSDVLYRITAVGPEPEDMMLQSRRHNEPDESFIDVNNAAEIDPDNNWIAAVHFTQNADLVHNFLYKPSK